MKINVESNEKMRLLYELETSKERLILPARDDFKFDMMMEENKTFR